LLIVEKQERNLCADPADLNRFRRLSRCLDLWSNKNIDPSLLLNSAIAQALAESDSKPGKARAITKQIDSLGIPGIATVKFAKESAPLDIALTQTFETIYDQRQAKKKVNDPRIVLIIDEAQQALSTDSGIAMMYALKAARDKLNNLASASGNPPLLLVFTGSSRPKLGALLQSKKDPFYGAKVSTFPSLGHDYCDSMTALLNSRLRDDTQVDKLTIRAAFSRLNFKPEALKATLAKALASYPIGDQVGLSLDSLIEQASKEAEGEDALELQLTFNSLTTLQQAVLVGILKGGENFIPYGQQARKEYAAYQQKESIETEANVQAAINALIDQEILWKPRRGNIQLDDEAWLHWYSKAKKQQISPRIRSSPPPPSASATAAAMAFLMHIVRAWIKHGGQALDMVRSEIIAK
jgi:hypothetical protein